MTMYATIPRIGSRSQSNHPDGTAGRRGLFSQEVRGKNSVEGLKTSKSASTKLGCEQRRDDPRTRSRRRTSFINDSGSAD